MYVRTCVSMLLCVIQCIWCRNRFVWQFWISLINFGQFRPIVFIDQLKALKDQFYIRFTCFQSNRSMGGSVNNVPENIEMELTELCCDLVVILQYKIRRRMKNETTKILFDYPWIIWQPNREKLLMTNLDLCIYLSWCLSSFYSYHGLLGIPDVFFIW